MRKGSVEEFPMRDQYTVSGLVVGGICWECECRVVEIGGEDRLTLAWCDCRLPEDHDEMEVLS
jgi:hypothetical protein